MLYSPLILGQCIGYLFFFDKDVKTRGPVASLHSKKILQQVKIKKSRLNTAESNLDVKNKKNCH